jgi:prepilin-type processing-associated H-X9-DG protein
MSMEKAIVSTTIGAEGIDHSNGVNIVLADGAEAFAQEVVRLFHDDEMRRRLGEAGRRLVLEKYDWNIVGSKLGEIYEKIKIG